MGARSGWQRDSGRHRTRMLFAFAAIVITALVCTAIASRALVELRLTARVLYVEVVCRLRVVAYLLVQEAP